MSKKMNLFAGFKKAKEKEMQSGSQAVKIKLHSARRLVISFVISAMFFCLCLVLIRSLTAEEETVSVWITTKEIPENLKVSDTWAGYCERKEVPVSLAPEGAVQDIGQIMGQYAECSISKNQILSSGMFRDKAAAAALFEEPIEVSVGAGSLAQIVGGTVREGDLVNISAVKGSYVTSADGVSTYSYQAIPITEKAYVTKTFTTAGAVVDSQDTEQPVTIINIIISAEQENAFNTALEEGTLRISRICD